MASVGDAAVKVLERAGVELDVGLTDAELRSLRDRFGFSFGPDHLSFITAALPVGDRWPNWRAGNDDELQRLMNWPIDGFVWDALNQDPPFWPGSWGSRPTDLRDIERIARRELAQWPVLVPIYGHRYTAASPTPPGSPVFSVYQTDVIYYGPNLVDYLVHEFGAGGHSRGDWSFPVKVPYWSNFVETGNVPVDK